MKRLKPLLLPVMALLELAALTAGWLLAFTHKPTARRWAALWMRTLPDGKWYWT